MTLRAVRGSLSASFDGMILAHFCVARIRDFGQGSDDCAYIIPYPFAKINTILSKFVQPALKSTAPASKFPSHQEAIRFVQRSFSCCSLRCNLIQIL